MEEKWKNGNTRQIEIEIASDQSDTTKCGGNCRDVHKTRHEVLDNIDHEEEVNDEVYDEQVVCDLAESDGERDSEQSDEEN